MSRCIDGVIEVGRVPLMKKKGFTNHTLRVSTALSVAIQTQKDGGHGNQGIKMSPPRRAAIIVTATPSGR
jgi:hypothetical protein